MPYTFNSWSLRKLISKTAKVEIERGVISIPIESNRDLDKADKYMKVLTEVLTDRPDNIMKINSARPM